MKNDLLIQRDVVAELDREEKVAADTIGVEVHHGVVKLAGWVSDPEMETNAELAARRVADVSAVVMDTDVTAAGTTVPSAADITRVAHVV